MIVDMVLSLIAYSPGDYYHHSDSGEG